MSGARFAVRAGSTEPGTNYRLRSVRDWINVIALALVAAVGALLAVNYPNFYRNAKPPLFDAHAYWLTGQSDWIPYSLPPGALDAYLYSPAFAQAISILTWLPWPVFAGVWLALETGAFLWLLKPLGWAWGSAFFLWCIPELYIGNIYAFLAVAVVLGLTRRPGAWALPGLTKPVLLVGALWFPIRGQWRAFLIAVITTAAIIAISLVLDPGLWRAYIGFLFESGADAASTYPTRVAVGVIVVVLAAILRRAWLVPMGLLVSLPVVGGISAFTILAAIPRLRRLPPDALGAGEEDPSHHG